MGSWLYVRETGDLGAKPAVKSWGDLRRWCIEDKSGSGGSAPLNRQCMEDPIDPGIIYPRTYFVVSIED